MSCEHLEHWYDDCRNCQLHCWACVDDMRNQRNDAHATIAELRAALEEARRNLAPWGPVTTLANRIDALLERTKPQ